MLKCLYQQMALSACSFSFSWSRWNSVCDEEKVVLQATEWLSSQPPKKVCLLFFKLVLVQLGNSKIF